MATNLWSPAQFTTIKLHDLSMQVLNRGTLKESGGYIVEEGGDISSDDSDRKAKDASSWKKRRRLVFAQNPGVIQVYLCMCVERILYLTSIRYNEFKFDISVLKYSQR